MDNHRTGADTAGASGGRDDDIVELAVAPGAQEKVVPHGRTLSKKSGPRDSAESALAAPSQRAAAAPSAPGHDDVVEITLDVRDDSVAVHSVKPAHSGDGGNEPDVMLLTGKLENQQRSSSYGHSVIRNASSRIKQVPQELRRLASVNSRGAGAGGRHLDRSKFAAGHTLKGLKFIKDEGPAAWEAVEKRFDRLANNGLLHRSDFGKCIGMWDTEFAAQLFDALAWRRNIGGGIISKAELFEFWDQISNTSSEIRLQTFVDMVAKNTDGRITEDVVKEMIVLSASANKLSKIQEQAEEYARLIMEELDPSNMGYIGLENLEMLLLQAPSQSGRQMQRESLRPTAEPNPLRRWYRSVQYFLEDNWKRVWVMLLWLSICMGLFTWKFLQYRRRYVFEVMGYCICVAKGGAETLKFNMALILLPVCRNTVTWIRNLTFVTRVVPIDDDLNFHEVIALGITIGVGLHIVPHLTCNFPRLLRAADAEYAPLAQYFSTSRDWRPPNYGWFVRGTEGWTGLVMLALMAIAFALATPCFRRGRLRLCGPLKRLTGFNAFWYSHHLFVTVYALLLVHGHFLYLTHKWYKKSTWMYLATPMSLYACERLTRALRSSMLQVKILKVEVYPGNTLSLHFSKPQGFQFKSGQYIFLNCPTISPFQWHPFWITSAPQDNYVIVHIRTRGDWTCELKNVFSKFCRPPMDGEIGLLRAECGVDHDENAMSNLRFPKVQIDGPYGSTLQDYKQYEAVLLISLGIGAAHHISIIKDTINNIKQLNRGLESGDANNDSVSSSSFRTRRIYFYWVTREQGSSEWFRSTMDEAAEIDKEGVIEFHTYVSSIYAEGDARSALIAVIQSLNYAKNGVDIVCGTRVKISHFARPNWCNVYKRIALNHRDQRVGVFYSGEPVLKKVLGDLARDFSRKTTTKFEFHMDRY